MGSNKISRKGMTWLLDAAIKFSKKIIAVIFILMILFTITMIVVYLVTGAVPDTLVQEFFGFFKVEGGCLAGIKVADTIVSWFKKPDEGSTEEEISEAYEKSVSTRAE